MDIVREFLQMIDCDLELLIFYMKVFDEDQEAFLQVVFALDHIFVRFQDDEGVTSLRSKVLVHAQRIISQHGPHLAHMLSSQVRHKLSRGNDSYFLFLTRILGGDST